MKAAATGTTLLRNITTLVQVADESRSAPLRGREMDSPVVRRDAAVLIDGDRIAWIGDSSESSLQNPDRVIDCSGSTVLPGFVDSHTHMVFAGDRSHELAMRLRGASYQQVAEAGGGILSTMRAVREATVEEIVERARPLVRSAFRHGSTVIEVKSGYGLDTASELKLLEAIRLLDEQEEPELISTFLGAHAFPPEYRENRDGYVDLLVEEMIPAVSEAGLAEYIDVFTDEGYFTVPQSERVIEAGLRHGLKPRVHADELADVGAAAMASRLGALSADHLLMVSDDGIRALGESGVMPTLLPGTAFYLGLPYAPARRLIEADLPVAIATDCNPGSNMSENMQMTLALSCMGMKMTIEEAITAATFNAAASLERAERVGSIAVGRQADLLILDVPDYPGMIYHYGVNHVRAVLCRGTHHDFGMGG